MICKPLFVGKNTIGDRYDKNDIFVFFSNRTFTEREYARLFPEKRLIFGKQVHGCNIEYVDYNSPNNLPETDGLITKEKNLALGIYTADCMPVLFYDDNTKIIAACHAGWRGVAQNIIGKTIKKMDLIKKNSLKVWIGPHIKKDSFEVHNDVAQTLTSQYTGNKTILFEHPTDKEKKLVDLTEIAKGQILEHNVNPENIWIHPTNTYSSDLYYSYRRDGSTGRLISFIYREASE